MLRSVVCIIILFCLPSRGVAAENFITVEILGKVLIDLPKNWVVATSTSDFRQTLDAAVQSQLEINEQANFPSETQYVAAYYDDAGSLVAQFSFRNNDDFLISQNQATQVGEKFINALDGGLKKGSETSANIIGIQILNWFGTNKIIIKGKAFFVTSYIRTEIDSDDLFKTHLIRFFDSGNNFTVIISYNISHSLSILLKPITDRIIQSIDVK